jgi:hypothetical protein
MAKAAVTEPAYVEELLRALQQEMPGAQIDHEQVRDDRYRFVVVWEGFESKGHPERQRKVWDIADRVLDKPTLLNVAMIITLAPTEVPPA